MSRTHAFFLFFAIVLVIYVLLNYYLYVKGRTVVPSSYRTFYAVFFWLLASSYFVGRLLERIAPSSGTTVLIWVGSYWLGVMAYGVFLFLLLDIGKLFLHIVPSFSMIQITKEVATMAAVAFLLVAIIVSRINALHPAIRVLDIPIKKHLPAEKITLVAVSDIHLGTMVCNSHFAKIINEVNALHPDVIVLVGDIVDEDVEPVLRNNFGELLRTLNAPYGVYGITGNHEYIGGVEKTCRYLEEHGIRMIRDSVVDVCGIVLVGREDISIQQFYGKRRKSLNELLSTVSRQRPLVVLDHQPAALRESVHEGVDLHLSGHTHHGQLFPFNFITSAVYELSWGYLQKGETHIYVSCGVGTWGPPLRSGNRPEIVSITFHRIE